MVDLNSICKCFYCALGTPPTEAHHYHILFKELLSTLPDISLQLSLYIPALDYRAGEVWMGRKAKGKQAFRNEGLQGESHKEERYCGRSWLSEHNFWRIWRLNSSQKRRGTKVASWIFQMSGPSRFKAVFHGLVLCFLWRVSEMVWTRSGAKNHKPWLIFKPWDCQWNKPGGGGVGETNRIQLKVLRVREEPSLRCWSSEIFFNLCIPHPSLSFPLAIKPALRIIIVLYAAFLTALAIETHHGRYPIKE